MSKDMEIQIRDFQIIRLAKLKFVPGLNVIQGESNNGKTAIFRAVKSAIYNVPGTTNVRYGADSYMVGIAYNGNTVVYKKGNETVYLVNGQQYNKPGRAQLEEVADALGIKLIDVNGANEQLNFWDQMDKPFLLDRTPTELFRFIVDSGKDDNIVQCMSDMVSDRQGINKQINASEGSIAQLNEQIAEVSAALTDADKVLEACESLINLGPQVAKKEELTTTAATIASTKTNIETIRANTTINEDTLNKIKDIKDKIQVSESKSEVIRSKKKRMSSLSDSTKQIRTHMNSLHYTSMPDTNRLNNLCSRANRLADIRNNIAGLSRNELKKVDIDYISLADLINRKDSFEFKKKRINEVKVLDDVWRKRLNDNRSLLELFDLCPLCNRPMGECKD